MAKVTVEDLVNLSAKELLEKMQRKVKEEKNIMVSTETAGVTTLGVVPPPESVSIPSGESVVPFDKKQLKGLFKIESVFNKGDKIQLGVYTLEVVSLESSSDRVRFKVLETNQEFSAARALLFGSKGELPFKKGQSVVFEGKVYEVKGLNPANKNVVIEVEGKKRYVKASKVVAADGSN